MEIKRGITRTVLLIGRYAVKFPSARAYGNGLSGVLWSLCRGVSANLSEREWSDSTGVCPVRWSLAGLVNVYERCEPVAMDYQIDWGSIGFIGPTDRKPDNVGWLNGHIVLIDYDMSWNDCPHGHPPRQRVSDD